MDSEKRSCQNCHKEFSIEPEDFLFYEKIKVPAPTFCPDCRKQRRLSWRNDFYLYSRSCDLCKKPIVSLYAPETKRVVYCGKCWWSDKWSAEEYARDFDFSRPFFEQLQELQESVPALALINDDGIASINCEYTQDFAFGKNCYLTFISWRVENALYSVYLMSGKEIVDSLNIFENSEYVYDSISIDASYRSRNLYYSEGMRESAFCYDCRDCSNCLLSVGLHHKQYCIKNKQYSKEEYEKILAEYKLDMHTGTGSARKEFAEFILMFPRKFAQIIRSVNSIGDEIDQCKNVRYGYNVGNGENCKFLQDCTAPKDSYDISVGGEYQECYESITPDQSYRNLFTIYSWKNIHVTYSDSCHSSKYLFGCVGIKKGEYRILNKQYTKESFDELRTKVIQHMQNTGEWGEFFPAKFSPFGYNISSAGLYFPLEKETALGKGFRWEEYIQVTIGKETIKEIPDSIHDVTEAITKETLACETCKRNYRILPQEFAFYKTMGIPIPRECFYCRNLTRFKLRNPQYLWHRTCTCAGAVSKNGVYQNQTSHFHGLTSCPNEFETSYAPDRPEIVYCEQCYQSEVV